MSAYKKADITKHEHEVARLLGAYAASLNGDPGSVHGAVKFIMDNRSTPELRVDGYAIERLLPRIKVVVKSSSKNNRTAPPAQPLFVLSPVENKTVSSRLKNAWKALFGA